MSEVSKKNESRLLAWIIGCVMAANLAAFGYAIGASPMLTFYVCTIYGPLLNAALLVAATVAVAIVKARDREVRLLRMLVVALGVPVLATIFFGIAGMLYVRTSERPDSEPQPRRESSARPEDPG